MTTTMHNNAAVASVDDFFDLPAIGSFFDANTTEVSAESTGDLEAMMASAPADDWAAPAALDDAWGLTALDQTNPFVPTTANADEAAAFVQHLNAGKPDEQCGSPTDITTSIMLTPAAKKKLSRPKAVKAATAREPSAKATAKPTPPTAVVLNDGTQDLELHGSAGSENGGNPLSVDDDDDDKKKADRMARNRASAAQSRKRKKQQVEELEEMIARLQDEVQALKKQNGELRSECARATGAAREDLPGNPPISPPLTQLLLTEANSAACA